MGVPQTIASRAVVVGDKELTVSTIRIAANYYDTAIFDDSAAKHHDGWSIGGYVINHSSVRALNRDGAMENHREALIAIREQQAQAPRPSA